MELFAENIVDWFTRIENSAYRMYARAGIRFKGDDKFSELLSNLQDETEERLNILSVANDFINRVKAPSLKVSIYTDSRNVIKTTKVADSYLIYCDMKEEIGTLTKADVISCMISVEFATYQIYEFGLKSLKESVEGLNDIGVSLGVNRERIVRYVEALDVKQPYIEIIRELPPLSKK